MFKGIVDCFLQLTTSKKITTIENFDSSVQELYPYFFLKKVSYNIWNAHNIILIK